jgi:hypothetical protein
MTLALHGAAAGVTPSPDRGPQMSSINTTNSFDEALIRIKGGGGRRR